MMPYNMLVKMFYVSKKYINRAFKLNQSLGFHSTNMLFNKSKNKFFKFTFLSVCNIAIIFYSVHISILNLYHKYVNTCIYFKFVFGLIRNQLNWVSLVIGKINMNIEFYWMYQLSKIPNIKTTFKGNSNLYWLKIYLLSKS